MIIFDYLDRNNDHLNHLDQNHDQFVENHIHDNQSDGHLKHLDENHECQDENRDNYHRDDAGHHNQ